MPLRWTIGLALLGLAAAAACGAPEPSPAATTAPGDYCDRNTTYWSAELVSGRADSALDYQEMGLSDAEYAIVRDVVAAHRSAAAGPTLTEADLGLIAARCQARRGGSVTSPPVDRGRTWPRG